MQDVLPFHETLCRALGVQFRLSYSDRMRWERFIFDVNQSLDEQEPLTTNDVRAVVALMQKQNSQGKAGWGLRYSKILMDSETFRDLVIETRRRLRPAKPVYVQSVQEAGEIRRQVEVAAPSEEEIRIRDSVRQQVLEFKRQHGRA